MIVKINGKTLNQLIVLPEVSIVDLPQRLSLTEKILYSAGAALATCGPTMTALAATAAGQDKIAKAFEPIMTMLVDLAGPVCRIMFILGFVLVIIGKPRQGIDKMKWAAIGYVGIQWTPMLMGIVEKAGESS